MQTAGPFSYDSYTHFPPTIVLSMGVLMSANGSAVVGSWPSTTRTAILPSSIDLVNLRKQAQQTFIPFNSALRFKSAESADCICVIDLSDS
jgi:hypothetical protein